MHLRTHEIMEKLSVGTSRNTFSYFDDIGASLWGGSIGHNIPKSTWKEFEKVQKHFLTKFLQVNKQTLYILLLLETRSLPLTSWSYEGLSNTCLSFKKVPHIDFLNCIGSKENYLKAT